jgi:hypothetical protein
VTPTCTVLGIRLCFSSMLAPFTYVCRPPQGTTLFPPEADQPLAEAAERRGLLLGLIP